MVEIFISFVHEEAAIAEALQAYISESYPNQKVFLSSDQWQVFAGEVWLDRIRQELEPAKVVVLLLSGRSVSRAWVNFEAGAAWLTNKMIIPACIGDLDKSALPKPYSNLQALNLPDNHYYSLSSIGHHLQWISPPPGFTDNSSRLDSLRFRIQELYPPAA